MQKLKKFLAIIVAILLLFTSYILNYNKDSNKSDTPSTISQTDNNSTTKSTPKTPSNTNESDSSILSTWGRQDTLQDHFDRHGPDFNAKSEIDYAKMAHALYTNRSKYEVKTDSSNIRIYDPKTNSFGAYNTNGTTKSFFKPSRGQSYFDDQPGELRK